MPVPAKMASKEVTTPRNEVSSDLVLLIIIYFICFQVYIRAEKFKTGKGTTAASATLTSGLMSKLLQLEYHPPPPILEEAITQLESEAIHQMLDHVTIRCKSEEGAAIGYKEIRVFT